MRTFLSVIFVTFALILTTGCQNNKATGTCACNPCTCAKPCPCTAGRASMGMMNDACPMSGRPVTDASPRSTWKEEYVGFCCNGCKGKFDEMTVQEQTVFISDNVKSQS